MKLELEIHSEQPLSIAEAIIEHEISHIKEGYTSILVRENIRSIGEALLNYVESCERIEEWTERMGES